MRNQFSSYVLSNQACQIRSHNLHSIFEIVLNLFSEFVHFQSLIAKILKASDIKFTDLLTHWVQRCIDNSFSNFSIPNNFLNLRSLNWGAGSIADQVNQLNKDLIFGDDLWKLREMPRVPFFNSHRKGIDIFVKKLKQADGLDDGLILSIDIEGNFISGEGVSQTKSWLI